MRIATFALAGLILAAACTSGSTETRTFDLKRLNANDAERLVSLYVPGDTNNIRVTYDPSAITVSAPPAALKAVEEILNRYDRAPTSNNVVLHFQIIAADDFTTTDTAIAAVESSLRQVFRYRGYRLVADAVLRGTPHSDVSQMIIGSDRVPYNLRSEVGRIAAEDSAKSVQLAISLAPYNQAPALRSSVNVPDGQTVIVGSARLGRDQPAIILVVRPTIE